MLSKDYLILLFLISGAFFNASCSSESEKDLVGVWKGYYGDTIVFCHFEKNQNCLISFKIAPETTIQNINGVFEIDYGKKPVPLSVRKIKELNHPLHTIVEFIDEDSIRMALFSPRWRLRPIAFEKNKIIYLKREKKEIEND